MYCVFLKFISAHSDAILRIIESTLLTQNPPDTFESPQFVCLSACLFVVLLVSVPVHPYIYFHAVT